MNHSTCVECGDNLIHTTNGRFHQSGRCQRNLGPAQRVSDKFDAIPLSSHGRKDDNTKPMLQLLPPRAIEEIGAVLTHGAAKYGPDNWRYVGDLQARYQGAALRHLFAHMKGERLDEDSGYLHLAHAVCSLLFMIEDIRSFYIGSLDCTKGEDV